jgi:hypothetical protein
MEEKSMKPDTEKRLDRAEPSPASAEGGMDRRCFLKCSALLGGVMAAGGSIPLIARMGHSAKAGEGGGPYSHYLPENQILSACQQCNTNCGIKVKIVDGMAAKIDGNPYSPWCLTPQIAEGTPIGTSARIEGSLCPKGQAGIQALYDPYRIVQVLKRAGKRGENKWRAIPFDQAVEEIVSGGDLFGEGHVDGLKDIVVLRDPDIAKSLAEDAALVASGAMTDRGVQGQARSQPALSHRSRPPRPGSQKQPAVPELGPPQERPRRSAQGLFRQGLRLGQLPRAHHGMPGVALFCRQGHERPVRGGQVHRRRQILLAGRHGQRRVLHLRGRQPLRSQLRPAPSGPEGHRGHHRRPHENRGDRPAVLQNRLPGLEVAAGGAGQRRPGHRHGHDPLDHRPPALRRHLPRQRQQSRGKGGQRAHLVPGRLAGQNRPGRDPRQIPARIGPGTPHRTAHQSKTAPPGSSMPSPSNPETLLRVSTPTTRRRRWRANCSWTPP